MYTITVFHDSVAILWSCLDVEWNKKEGSLDVEWDKKEGSLSSLLVVMDTDYHLLVLVIKPTLLTLS